jgi:hypothetical protein
VDPSLGFAKKGEINSIISKIYIFQKIFFFNLLLGVGVWRDFQSPEVMRARKPKAKKRVKKSSHSFIWFFSLFFLYV